MIIETSNNSWIIKFKYDDMPMKKVSKDQYGRETVTTWKEAVTVCIIKKYKKNPRNAKLASYSQFVGYSQCNYKDKITYSKPRGQVTALINAFDESPLSEAERKEIIEKLDLTQDYEEYIAELEMIHADKAPVKEVKAAKKPVKKTSKKTTK